jgi:two-component system CheB/CheR fusion protein
LSIEIWDSGVGIDPLDLDAIFDEYHQVDNAARERSRGLGLGLSIVKRLGDMLGHTVRVRSTPGKGSVFAIDVTALPRLPGMDFRPNPVRPVVHPTGNLLMIEDDPEVRELLEILIRDDGHHVAWAHDGADALRLAKQARTKPDLILSDYNLPGGMNGVEATRKVRDLIGRPVPVIILTADISTTALRDIADHDCEQLNKPVKPKTLIQSIRRLLATPLATPDARSIIHIVDDDLAIRVTMREMLETHGYEVADYADCAAFLAAFQPARQGCLLIDAYLPGMTGLELLQNLSGAGHRLPAIMITGNGDVKIAVEAMKAGASDFIEKPIGAKDLLASVAHALELAHSVGKRSAQQVVATRHLADLTRRQHQIMDMVLAGQPSKIIAADLGISQRTVENHRAAIMSKTGATSIPALARMAITAENK